MKQTIVLRILTDKDCQSYTLKHRMVLVGSSSECDIQIAGLPDLAFKIEPDGDKYRIELLGINTLRKNGKKSKDTLINYGDRFEFDNILLFIDNTDFKDCSEAPYSPNSRLSENLHQLIESICTEKQIPILLNKLMDALLKITTGTDIFIFKLNADKKPQIFVTSGTGTVEERFSDTIVQTVLKAGNGLFISSVLTNPIYNSSKSIADLKLLSVLCTPIKFASQLTGLIYIGSRNAAISYTKQDLDDLQLYATITGMLINNIEIVTYQNSIIKKLSTSVTDGIIAESKEMQQVLSTISSIADAEITILLEGETGSGKSKIAQLIHQNSKRKDKPFIVINCSSLRGELLESELFGHKKGSFTGAFDDHEGLFKAAHGGVLFLDEIGELELPLQAKLLRTLETQTIRPIGSTKEFPADVRIICATNRNLKAMIGTNTFRSDLYYRINQFSITISPLRKRTEDLIPLSYYYLEHYKSLYPSKDIFDFHPETIQFIQSYDWPGNIRELMNVIHRAVLTSTSPLITFDMNNTESTLSFDFESATKNFQKDLIHKTIVMTCGNKDAAAKKLGLSRSTFFRYQAQLGL
jgi:transcriptional regulator with GAF, ATPase, and Fis domain